MSALACNAQNELNIGFKTGLSYTKLIWELRENSGFPEERIESKKKAGYFFQLSADLIKRKHWNWNSSLGVLQKNGEFEFYVFRQNSTSVSPNIYKWTYLSFTNLARTELALNKSIYLTGNIGPRIDYLIKNSNDSFSVGGAFFYRDNGDINKINIGLSGGLGIMFQLNKVKLGLEGNRNINFNSIMNVKGPRADGYGDEGFYFKVKDNTFILNTLLLIAL